MTYVYFKKNNLMMPSEKVKRSFIQAYNENDFMRHNFVEVNTPTSPKKQIKSGTVVLKKFNPVKDSSFILENTRLTGFENENSNL